MFSLEFKIFWLHLKRHMLMSLRPTDNDSYRPFNNSRLTVYLNPKRGIWKLVMKIIAHFVLLGIYFRGDLAGLGITFFQWCRFSPIRAQIGQELVRLITMINLNNFLINTISPKPPKTFSRTKFRWFVVRICSFLVFKQFYKQF